MTTYYLNAGAARHKGVRYTRGGELPAELGKQLADRGLAVTDLAHITTDRRPEAALASKVTERSTIGAGQTVAGDPDAEARIAELEEEIEGMRRELDAANQRERARVEAEGRENPVVAEVDGKVQAVPAGPIEPPAAKAPAKAPAKTPPKQPAS